MNTITRDKVYKFKYSKKQEIQIDFDLEKISIFNQSTTKNICVSDKEFISLAEGGGSQ